jgi:hypothetical protein
MAKPERWFTDEELAAMSRPTMDRALEALDSGDVATARRLCDEMRYEWRWMHDLLVGGIASLISFIAERDGEDAVAEAWRYGNDRGWRHQVRAVERLDRREVVRALATTWRAHSGSGTGPHPGAFTITEDDEKVVFTMNPCGSGQRLWRMGRYRGEGALRVTEQAHDWSYERTDFPMYCTHCAFMNEIQPIEWVGYPIYPSDPPDDFDSDPCTWYWYKDPAGIPERHWTRYGRRKDARPDARS